MAANDIYVSRFIGLYESQQVNCVLHWRAKTGSATPTGLGTAINTTASLKDLFVTGLSNQLTWSAVQITPVIPFGTATVEQALTSWVGGSSAVRMPGECSMVITKRTGFIGRSRRGRMYMVGAPQSQAIGGTWISAFVSAEQAYANAVVAAFGAGGSNADYELGVWSRELAGTTPPYNFAAYAAVTSLLVRAEIRSQRRRQVGVGA